MFLSDIKIQKSKPENKPYKLKDGDGLWLLIHPNGSKYWRLRYHYAGKEKMLALAIIKIFDNANHATVHYLATFLYPDTNVYV